jgi:hypothetical protein
MKNKMRPTQLVFLLVSFFMIGSCTTRKSIPVEEGWEFLGEQSVNFVTDKDRVEINSNNKFTAIKFKVEDREVRLQNLVIFLENGDKLQPAMDDVIAADQFSREISIASEGRYIDKIEFSYRTTGNVLKGRANVLVYGRKFDPYNQ